MPGPLVHDPYAHLPPWLDSLLLNLSVSPVTTAVPTGMFRGMAPEEAVAPVVGPELKSIGKRVEDLLGAVFKTEAPGSGLPKRLSLSNWNARTGQIQLHAGETPMEIAPNALDKLIGSGQVGLEQPPASPSIYNALMDTLRPVIGKGK